MSMIGNFALAPASRIEALLDDPESVQEYLYPDEAADEDPDPSVHLDVDKAWHGLHYLFTGTAWEGDAPLNFIVSGGEEIGDVDLGYGPGRAFTPAEVKRIDAALQKLDPDELRRRFNPAQMKELKIYPDIWDRPPEQDDTLGYLLEYFGKLKPFIHKGAQDGLGLLVYVN